MASPVHVALLVSTVVNGGDMIRPTLVKGTVDQNREFTEQPIPDRQKVFSTKTADIIKGMMLGVLGEEGTSPAAQPFHLGAGGKSGTAETGWIEQGEKVIQRWFAGYYPAEEPRYVITVLAENSDQSGEQSAPVFKEICEELYLMELVD